MKDTVSGFPNGIEGFIIDVKVLSRRGIDKDDRRPGHRGQGDIELPEGSGRQLKIILDSKKAKMVELLEGRTSPRISRTVKARSC